MQIHIPSPPKRHLPCFRQIFLNSEVAITTDPPLRGGFQEVRMFFSLKCLKQMSLTLIRSPVDVYRDMGYSQSRLCFHGTVRTLKRIKHLFMSYLVKTEKFYFAFVITRYSDEFCATNKCEQ